MGYFSEKIPIYINFSKNDITFVSKEHSFAKHRAHYAEQQNIAAFIFELWLLETVLTNSTLLCFPHGFAEFHKKTLQNRINKFEINLVTITWHERIKGRSRLGQARRRVGLCQLVRRLCLADRL
jgi:GH24 family phage-related lysozyme (muramidase)